MSETMVARVRDAILRRVPEGYGMMTGEAEEFARAAIEAMREPTPAMVDAAGNAFFDAAVAHEHGDKANTPFIRFHRAAIDAALSESGSGEW